MPGSIRIRGARNHNLKNVDVHIPRDRLVVVTGLSGSGKSTLAFDTLYAEGQRRYVESLSAYARQFLEQTEKPDCDLIDGLSPAIAIEQRGVGRNPRSTVATITEVADHLRLLYARVGTPICHGCGRPISAQTVQQVVDRLLALPADTRMHLFAPVVRDRKGEHREELDDLRRRGFVRVRVVGELRELDGEWTLARTQRHTVEVLVDRLVLRPGLEKRLGDSLEVAFAEGRGVAVGEAERPGAPEAEALCLQPETRLPHVWRVVSGAGAAALLVQQPARRVPRVQRVGCGAPGRSDARGAEPRIAARSRDRGRGRPCAPRVGRDRARAGGAARRAAVPPAPGLAAVEERPDTGIAKHQEYALTWFSLAATVAALWVGLNLRRVAPLSPARA